MAVTGATGQVEGYTDFLRAIAKADRATKTGTRKILRTVGDSVKAGAARKIAGKSPRSAAGYRTYVRQRGIEVGQSLRKSAAVERRRPNFGGLQMGTALVPALNENEAETVRAFEAALDQLARTFNGGGLA